MQGSLSVSPSKSTPAHNRLLAALPALARRKVLARCEQIELAVASVLCEPGERIRHVFFPIDSVISLVAPSAGAASLEVGLVGDEGVMGLSLMLGVSVAPFRGLVRGAGRAWRMEAADFLRELDRSPALRRKLSQYLYVTMIQLAQAAACTRFHVIEARLARWLLMTRDRAHANRFPITHDFLAYILGVRRVGITRAASSLQQRNFIRYSRGDLRILDGRGLESASCGCYAADKSTYRRVMGSSRQRASTRGGRVEFS
jgi:CRP-like cAMP-binding protein